MYLNDLFTEDLVSRAGVIEKRGTGNPAITGLEYDSRKVAPGNLYFALPGLHADGHAFIASALERGAAAIVHQRPLEECSGFDSARSGAVFIRVKDSRFAMSPSAAAFYGFPAERLILAGVTGTEGKSTTVYLIWQLLCLAGKKAGFVSTVQYSDGGEAAWNAEHQTTPEAPAIHKRLAEMVHNGTEYAVIEASSHGLSKRTNRLGDVFFDAAVMTNVTHEHLEFHGTWEQYRDDKANLFRSLDSRADGLAAGHTTPRPAPFGVINACDKNAAYFATATQQKVFFFAGTAGGDTGVGDAQAGAGDAGIVRADLAIRSIESGAEGNRYEVYCAAEQDAAKGATGKTFIVEDALPGAFNAQNVLAALLTVSGLTGKPVEELVPLVSSLKPVRGRMTAVNRGQDFEVIVDYAHTPSSFEAIFPPLRFRLDRSGGRIISLFGSAGERDTAKRSLQGAIAARYSDIVILTDEDPRGEDPMTILEEIARGCETPGCETDQGCEAAGNKIRRGETLYLIPERPAAIRKAFSFARRGDLVLLLGKGHENSIIYKDHTMKYDEITEAENALSGCAG